MRGGILTRGRTSLSKQWCAREAVNEQVVSRSCGDSTASPFVNARPVSEFLLPTFLVFSAYDERTLSRFIHARLLRLAHHEDLYEARRMKYNKTCTLQPLSCGF